MQRYGKSVTMVKGQPIDNRNKDTGIDGMELEQGKQKKVCNQPTPEKMKEKGLTCISLQNAAN